MKITFKAPFQDDELLIFDNEYNITLGAILGKYEESILKVAVNGRFFPEWQLFIGEKDDDEVEVFFQGPEVTGLLTLVVQLILSLIISFILQALAPKPKQPKQPKPSWGVAGIANAIAPGTPKFLVYGKRRVFGFLIASRVDLVKPLKNNRLFRKMTFSALYFMGAGHVKAIELPKVNTGGTNIADFPGNFHYNVRLGTEDQDVIPLHDNVHQTYHVGKVVPSPSKDDPDKNVPIVETTRGLVDKITIVLNFPNGLFSVDKEDGSTEKGWYKIQIKYKKNSDPDWLIFTTTVYRGETQDGCFAKEEIEVEEKGRYDVSVQCVSAKRANQSGEFAWYNMMETQYILTNYPGSSLMEIGAMGSEQVTSIEDLESSGLVCGRIIPVWDSTSQMIIWNWTRSRAWICRDILTNKQHCLGGSFTEEMINDGTLIAASTGWEVDQVQGYDGLEDRDYCDVILGVNGAESGWDVLKHLTYEGETRLMPVRGLLAYVVDAGEEPGLTCSEPGSIIESSVESEYGRNDKSANTIKASFANEDNDYKETYARLVRRAGLGDDYERAEEMVYDSITRPSQIARKMRKDIERIDLVDRFWNWKCDREFLRYIPLDSVRLSYWTLSDRKGVSGFVAANSTSTIINLDRLVTLEAGYSYSLYIHHKRTGTVEKRTVVTPAGKWGQLYVSSPYTTEVHTGDILVLGIDEEQIENVLIDSIERSNDGLYIVKASILVPSVYEIDSPLPEIIEFVNADETLQGPQQPIEAQAVGNVEAETAEFKVAPGFNHYRGWSSSVGEDYAILESKEPAIDDFFNGYTIELDVGSGHDTVITDYDGATRRATLRSDVGLWGSQSYRLTSPPSAKFNGFKVESSPTGDDPWTSEGQTTSTELSIAGLHDSTDYFRITPLSPQGLENTVGRQIVQLSAGDSTPPSAPTQIVLRNETKKIIVDVTFQFPLDRDTWKINVELNDGAPEGSNLATEELDISLQRDEDNDSGSYVMSIVIDLSNVADDTTVYGRANIEDFFGNVSDWTDAADPLELSAIEGDDPQIDADPTTVVVANTIIETEIFARRIKGGTLDKDGAIFGRVEMKVTDSNASNDAYVTFTLRYGQQVGATLVVKTSDLITNIGTDIPWHLDFLLGAKNSRTSQLLVLSFAGHPVLTNNPAQYPGPVVSKAFGTTSVDSANTKQLELTAQWSAADITLSLTKHYDYSIRAKAEIYQT